MRISNLRTPREYYPDLQGSLFSAICILYSYIDRIQIISAQWKKKRREKFLVEDISFNGANASQDNTTKLSGCSTTSHTLPNLPSSCDTNSACKPKPYLHTPGSFVLCQSQRRRSSPGVQITMATVTCTPKMAATICLSRNAETFTVHAL